MANLCTVAQVKSRINLTGTQDDIRIGDLITQAEKTIMRRYGREFTPQVSSATRNFRATGRYVELSPYDLRTATAVILDPDGANRTLTATTDYILSPIGSDPLTGTYTSLQLASDIALCSDYYRRYGFVPVRVTGDWGIWNAGGAPEDVQAAVIETVAAWLDRSVGKVTGSGVGSGRDNTPAIPTTWDIPASAHRKLSPYARLLGAF